ncbi:MAG: hypothetical protein MN733_03835, partial [Nitrososphaera sp.]|nr:hypothetical protein [Nitrososphaera sp.]
MTGIGGMGGLNFVRSLRAAKEQFFIVGTDFNPYYIEFADVNHRVRTPRHSDRGFMPTMEVLIQGNEISFIHPSPSAEAKMIAQNGIGCKTFLPDPKEIAPDKIAMFEVLDKA